MLQDEINFWCGLQKKYLEPLKENKAEQEKIANDLRELRNKVSLYATNISQEEKILFKTPSAVFPI